MRKLISFEVLLYFSLITLKNKHRALLKLSVVVVNDPCESFKTCTILILVILRSLIIKLSLFCRVLYKLVLIVIFNGSYGVVNKFLP